MFITEGGLAGQDRASRSREAKVFSSEEFVDPVIARRELMSELKRRDVGFFARGVAGAAFDANLYLQGDPELATRTGVGSGFVFGGLDDFDGDNREQEEVVDLIIGNSRRRLKAKAGGGASGEPIRIELDVKSVVELQDQNANAIPHKSDVNLLSEQ